MSDDGVSGNHDPWRRPTLDDENLGRNVLFVEWREKAGCWTEPQIEHTYVLCEKWRAYGCNAMIMELDDLPKPPAPKPAK